MFSPTSKAAVAALESFYILSPKRNCYNESFLVIMHPLIFYGCLPHTHTHTHKHIGHLHANTYGEAKSACVKCVCMSGYTCDFQFRYYNPPLIDVTPFFLHAKTPSGPPCSSVMYLGPCCDPVHLTALTKRSGLSILETEVIYNASFNNANVALLIAHRIVLRMHSSLTHTHTHTHTSM